MTQGGIGYVIKAWKVLPVNKDQDCALGAVDPNITIIDHLEKPNGRKKRSLNPLTEHPTLFHNTVRTLLPCYGVMELESDCHLSCH